MGFLSDMLRGREPSTTVDTRSTLTPEQEAALSDLFGFFRSRGGAEVEPEGFGGQLSADLSGRELTSLAALEQRALGGAEDPLRNASSEALMGLIKGQGQPTGFEDFFRTNVENPSLRGFQENVRPAISRKFGGSSFFSNERARADDASVRELLETLTQSRGDLAFQSKEAGLNRLMQALGLQQSRDTGDIDNLIKSLGAFGVEREVKQGGLDREFGEFTRVQDEKARRIAQLLAAIGTSGRENIATVDPGKTGLIETFLASLASGAGKGLGGSLTG